MCTHRPHRWVEPSHASLQPGHCSADQPTCCHSQPPALPPLAPGATMRASRLHPRTPHWCSAAVGASQVSGRHSGRPSSPPSRRDWCQGCALPGRLPSSPARHPVEPVLGVRGQAFLGGECLPHAALAPALLGGPWWCLRAAAGLGQETGASEPGVQGDAAIFRHAGAPLGTEAEPWAALLWCLLPSGPSVQGFSMMTCKTQNPSLCPQLGPSTHGKAQGPSCLSGLAHSGSPVVSVPRILGTSREVTGRWKRPFSEHPGLPVRGAPPQVVGPECVS